MWRFPRFWQGRHAALQQGGGGEGGGGQMERTETGSRRDVAGRGSPRGGGGGQRGAEGAKAALCGGEAAATPLALGSWNQKRRGGGAVKELEVWKRVRALNKGCQNALSTPSFIARS